MRGVDPKTTYRVTFEDGTNLAIEKSGAELVKGIKVALEARRFQNWYSSTPGSKEITGMNEVRLVARVWWRAW